QLPLRSDKPSTQCDIECTSEVGVPVCGNDGRTYESRCEIEKAKCQGHPVEFKHRGKCIVCPFSCKWFYRRVVLKIRFPRSCTLEESCYALFGDTGVSLGFLSPTFRLVELSVTLVFGLAAIIDGVPTRLSRQVRFTLCELFFVCKKHFEGRHSFLTA
ncbi:SPARC-related modular calcium-binding protein 1, partial [Nephila pilipes]